MMRIKKGMVLGLLLTLMFLLAACGSNRVKGSGNIDTRDYDVSGYDKIEINNIGQFEIIQGDKEGVTLETDDNYFEYVTINVSGKTLQISQKSGVNFDFNSDINFTIYVRSLNELALRGAGDIQMNGLKSDAFEIDLSGAGDVKIEDVSLEKLDIGISGAGNLELSGKAVEQSVVLSGIGAYDAADLETERTQVNLSGAGTITVWVTESLAGNLSGAGQIHYYGEPSQMSVNKTGAGSVKNLGGR